MKLRKTKKTPKAKVEKEKQLTLEEEVCNILERLQLGEYSSKEPHQRTIWGYDLAHKDIKEAFLNHGYRTVPQNSMALDDMLSNLVIE